MVEGKVIRSVQKALQILDCFSEEYPEQTVTGLSKQLDLPKSSVATTLATLQACGYVSKNPQTQAYHLGLRLFELGHISRTQLTVPSHILLQLEELQNRTGEIVYLAIPRNGRVLYLECIYPSPRLIPYSYAGKLGPMHCTGLGKAMLAHMTDEDVEEVASTYGLKAYTENTIATLDGLKAELSMIRARGYAVDNGEHYMSLKCVAAAIQGSNKVLGAVSVSCPANRMTTEREEYFSDQIMQTISHISQNSYLAALSKLFL